MTDEERVGIVAAFAIAAGASFEAAWLIAAEALAEHPDDLVEATREVTRRANLTAWGLPDY